MNKKKQLREKYKKKGLVIINELSEFKKLFKSNSIDTCEVCKKNNLKVMEYEFMDGELDVCFKCFKKKLWIPNYGMAHYDDDIVTYCKSINLWFDYKEDVDGH